MTTTKNIHASTSSSDLYAHHIYTGPDFAGGGPWKISRMDQQSKMDPFRLSIARFMRKSISLRDMVGRYGNLSLLSEDELNCIVNYLATY